jgi:hypothetical protein
MPDFTTISQAPEIRALVQENLLERAFHDALFPRLLFRGAASPVLWPNNVGDNMVFTGTGLMRTKQKPLTPGTDPLPSTYQVEQWESSIQQYADTIDTAMPTSISAIANLFLRNAQQLGLGAGQTMNRIVRNRMFNAAQAGHTVVDGAGQSSTTIRIKRLNGFTRARTPTLVGASAVRFQPVSSSNPLAITIGGSARNVIGFTADNAGDEVGPGVVLLDATIAPADRAAVLAVDRTFLVRVGGGDRVDDVGSSDLLTLASIRAAVSRMRNQNVPEMPDGRFHCHLDPISESQVFADAEFQRLLQSLPDYFMYRQFAVGELLGTVFFRNSENPQRETVEGGLTAVFTEDDPFGAELYSNGVAATGVRIHRALFAAQGGIFEYYQDMSAMITEAGITGKQGQPSITNNGIEVMTERVALILRSPQNRLQDLVSASWKFIGDWPVRTDATTGDTARIKRFLSIEHGE